MYDYKEAIKNDISEYIAENEYYLTGYTRDELEDKLNDDLWIEDSVTGNGSGSYTFSRYDAQQYVTEDGMQYLQEAAEEGFLSSEETAERFLSDDFEYFDVTIRCYLLSQCIHEVLDELESDTDFFEDEEDYTPEELADMEEEPQEVEA